MDLVRGVAIFGVLVLHSRFSGRFTPETLAIQTLLARLFDWSVLAFFFSSGFLHDRSAPVSVTLKKRFISLLVPFFFYNALYNLFFLVGEASGLVPGRPLELNSKLLATCFFQSPGFQLYFLPYLFVISTGVCAVDKLIFLHGKTAYRLLLGLVLGFYVYTGYPEFSYGPDYSRVPLYLAVFLVGVISRPFFAQRFLSVWMTIALLGVVLALLMVSRLPIVSFAVPPLLVGLARTIPRLKHSNPLVSMGAISGSIYLWHTPLLLPAFASLLAHLGIPSPLVLFGCLSLTLVTCVLLRIALDRFFEHLFKRPTPRFITL